jgi:hypothetical protein
MLPTYNVTTLINEWTMQPTNQATVCLSVYLSAYLPNQPINQPNQEPNQPNQPNRPADQLTNSMQHSPPWEAKSCLYSHDIPCIYANQRFITVFTKVCHMSLSFNKSSPLHPILFSLMSIFTFSSHILAGLQSGHFPSGFPIKILYTFLVYPIQCTCLSKGTLSEEHERHYLTLMTQPNTKDIT